MKQAKKRPMRTLERNRPTFAEALVSMPNVGTDADFARRDAVDQMLQFMRDVELTGAPFNLKEIIEDGRASQR